MSVQWEELDAEAFDALPEPTKPPKSDAEWEELVTALESGKAVKVPFADEKEMRGKRLSLGRRSIRRGFKVDLRYGDGFIAARRRADGAEPDQQPLPLPVPAPAPVAGDEPQEQEAPARGRRKRTS